MEAKCANCKFYEPINHRGQRYPKGFCKKHTAYRLGDRFEIHLTIASAHEFVCNLHELAPQPTYALVNGETFLVPPVVADELVKQGWVRVQLDSDGEKIVVRKEDE